MSERRPTWDDYRQSDLYQTWTPEQRGIALANYANGILTEAVSAGQDPAEAQATIDGFLRKTYREKPKDFDLPEAADLEEARQSIANGLTITYKGAAFLPGLPLEQQLADQGMKLTKTLDTEHVTLDDAQQRAIWEANGKKSAVDLSRDVWETLKYIGGGLKDNALNVNADKVKADALKRMQGPDGDRNRAAIRKYLAGDRANNPLTKVAGDLDTPVFDVEGEYSDEDLAERLAAASNIDTSWQGVHQALSDLRTVWDNSLQNFVPGAYAGLWEAVIPDVGPLSEVRDNLEEFRFQQFKESFERLSLAEERMRKNALALEALTGVSADQYTKEAEGASIVLDPSFVAGYVVKPIAIAAKVGKLGKTAQKVGTVIAKVQDLPGEVVTQAMPSKMGQMLRAAGEKVASPDAANAIGRRVGGAVGGAGIALGVDQALQWAGVQGFNPQGSAMTGAIAGGSLVGQPLRFKGFDVTKPVAWSGQQGYRLQRWLGDAVIGDTGGLLIKASGEFATNPAIDSARIANGMVRKGWDDRLYDAAHKSQFPGWAIRGAARESRDLAQEVVNGGFTDFLFGYMATSSVYEGLTEAGEGLVTGPAGHYAARISGWSQAAIERGQHPPNAAFLNHELDPMAVEAQRATNRAKIDAQVHNQEGRDLLRQWNAEDGPDGVVATSQMLAEASRTGLSVHITKDPLVMARAMTMADMQRRAPDSYMDEFDRFHQDRAKGGAEWKTATYAGFTGVELNDKLQGYLGNVARGVALEKVRLSNLDPKVSSGTVIENAVVGFYNPDLTQTLADQMISANPEMDPAEALRAAEIINRRKTIRNMAHEVEHRNGMHTSRMKAAAESDQGLRSAMEAETAAADAVLQAIEDQYFPGLKSEDPKAKKAAEAKVWQLFREYSAQLGSEESANADVAYLKAAMLNQPELFETHVLETVKQELRSAFREGVRVGEVQLTYGGAHEWAKRELSRLEGENLSLFEALGNWLLGTDRTKLEAIGVKYGPGGIVYDGQGNALTPAWARKVLGEMDDAPGVRVAVAKHILAQERLAQAADKNLDLRNERVSAARQAAAEAVGKSSVGSVEAAKAATPKPKVGVTGSAFTPGTSMQELVQDIASMPTLQMVRARVDQIVAGMDAKQVGSLVTAAGLEPQGSRAENIEVLKQAFSSDANGVAKPDTALAEEVEISASDAAAIVRISEDANLRGSDDPYAMRVTNNLQGRYEISGIPTQAQLDALEGILDPRSFNALAFIRRVWREEGAGREFLIDVITKTRNGQPNFANKALRRVIVLGVRFDYDPVVAAASETLDEIRKPLEIMRGDPDGFKRWWTNEATPEQQRALVDALNAKQGGPGVALKGDAKGDGTTAARGSTPATIHKALFAKGGFGISIRTIDAAQLTAKLGRLGDLNTGQLFREQATPAEARVLELWPDDQAFGDDLSRYMQETFAGRTYRDAGLSRDQLNAMHQWLGLMSKDTNAARAPGGEDVVTDPRTGNQGNVIEGDLAKDRDLIREFGLGGIISIARYPSARDYPAWYPNLSAAFAPNDAKKLGKQPENRENVPRISDPDARHSWQRINQQSGDLPLSPQEPRTDSSGSTITDLSRRLSAAELGVQPTESPGVDLFPETILTTEKEGEIRPDIPEQVLAEATDHIAITHRDSSLKPIAKIEIAHIPGSFAKVEAGRGAKGVHLGQKVRKRGKSLEVSPEAEPEDINAFMVNLYPSKALKAIDTWIKEGVRSSLEAFDISREVKRKGWSHNRFRYQFRDPLDGKGARWQYQSAKDSQWEEAKTMPTAGTDIVLKFRDGLEVQVAEPTTPASQKSYLNILGNLGNEKGLEAFVFDPTTIERTRAAMVKKRLYQEGWAEGKDIQQMFDGDLTPEEARLRDDLLSRRQELVTAIDSAFKYQPVLTGSENPDNPDGPDLPIVEDDDAVDPDDGGRTEPEEFDDSEAIDFTDDPEDPDGPTEPDGPPIPTNLSPIRHTIRETRFLYRAALDQFRKRHGLSKDDEIISRPTVGFHVLDPGESLFASVDKAALNPRLRESLEGLEQRIAATLDASANRQEDLRGDDKITADLMAKRRAEMGAITPDSISAADFRENDLNFFQRRLNALDFAVRNRRTQSLIDAVDAARDQTLRPRDVPAAIHNLEVALSKFWEGYDAERAMRDDDFNVRMDGYQLAAEQIRRVYGDAEAAAQDVADIRQGLPVRFAAPDPADIARHADLEAKHISGTISNAERAEAGHHIEGTPEWDGIRQYVINALGSGAYDHLRNAYLNRGYDPAEVEREIINDAIGYAVANHFGDDVFAELNGLLSQDQMAEIVAMTPFPLENPTVGDQPRFAAPELNEWRQVPGGWEAPSGYEAYMLPDPSVVNRLIVEKDGKRIGEFRDLPTAVASLRGQTIQRPPILDQSERVVDFALESLQEQFGDEVAPGMVGISASTDGIGMSFIAPGFKNLDIDVAADPDSPGDVRVVLDDVKADGEMGGGRSAQLVSALESIAGKVGAKSIALTAKSGSEYESGGYVWLRRGFIPHRNDMVIIRNIIGKRINGALKAGYIDQTGANAMREALKETDPAKLRAAVLAAPGKVTVPGRPLVDTPAKLFFTNVLGGIEYVATKAVP